MSIHQDRTDTGRLAIKGELTAREDVAIDGAFEGSIDVGGHELTIGAASRVDATVAARVVTVHGRLKGAITADVLDVADGAQVDASVMARSVALEEGARFNGAVNTERARAAGEIARRRFANRQSPIANP